MKRCDKFTYYLDIAQTVAERSTCLRRRFGAIIVNNDEIIATGYNGAPRGRANCSDAGGCLRERLGVPHGQRYELCRAVHAEANCIISAPRTDMLGAALYLVGIETATGDICCDTEPCSMCKRLIINAGISSVIIRVTPQENRVVAVKGWIENDESLVGSEGY